MTLRPAELRICLEDRTHSRLQAIAKQRRVSVSVVAREAFDVYLAHLAQEPVPAKAGASPTPPRAIEAPTPARARASARWCMPRRVPGGREE